MGPRLFLVVVVVVKSPKIDFVPIFGIILNKEMVE